MPRDTSIKSVLVIGSGPIVIGQACEFDYSGTQACRVLRAEGIRVVLVNSNPATIMTDPEFADATYIEPITPEFIERIIAKERPDAVLATLGGQTALNAAIGLHKAGTLQRYGAQLIGADVDAIERGENREIFRTIVEKIGGESAKSIICHTMEEVIAGAAILNYPVVVRPSFTMGGLGSGIAFEEESLRQIAGAGLRHSPTTEVLLEESILGWKEYELEVMRDKSDNVVIVCSIENIDPMGVHTGDSITVAPALTLTDVEFQKLRNLSIDIIREVGVATGGCNIQFAVNPDNGRILVIEMNPRVSRSSALASKATGFPIAKIATKLAIGYTLDEIKNDINQGTGLIRWQVSRDFSTIFAVFLFGGLMLVGAVASLLMTFSIVRGNRPPSINSLTWLAAFLFAIFQVRSQMPGNPPSGVKFDMLIFFPVILLLICLIMVNVSQWNKREDWDMENSITAIRGKRIEEL
jgi:carbamoyl-phosphate synthase large subunit